MPIVVMNWLDNLIATKPNKNTLNLVGKLMDQVHQYMVMSADEIDAIGLWLTRDTMHVDQAINYIASKKVDMNAKG